MTILSEEARALLQRMDADDAINAAARAGFNAAIEAAGAACHNIAFDQRRHNLTAHGAFLCKTAVLALKEDKQNG